MTDHCVQFERTAGGMMLTNAILLYRSDGARGLGSHLTPGEDAEAFASIHKIEHDAIGAPTIAAGTPLTRAHLRHWSQALGRVAPPQILPETVLVAHPDLLVWWVPAQVRTAYFDLSAKLAGLRALGGRAIVPVAYPAHVLVATRRRLGVFALERNERPAAETALLHSPILNVFLNGSLCWGNIPKPTSLDVSAIPEFERALFDSWSTHPNPGQELTITGKGGLVRLWDTLAATRATRFPVKRLRPFLGDRRQTAPRGAAKADPVTLGDLIYGRSGR